MLSRLVILKSKIEGLPDDHRFKPDCLFELSRLFYSAGNNAECKRLLTHALKLERERGNTPMVARLLTDLSDTNRDMGLLEEGIQQVKEGLEMYERLGHTVKQADSLIRLAWLMCIDQQLDAAEEATSRAIGLLEKGNQYKVCESHRILGYIYRSRGETEKAIHHYEVAIGIASSFNWHDALFWAHCGLVGLCRTEGRLDDASAHIEHAKSHVADNAYFLGRAMELQAEIWHEQHRLEEARSEALRAADLYEKLGAAGDVIDCRELLQKIEKELNNPGAPGQLGFDCELL